MFDPSKALVKLIDRILNPITMYRLVLYYLLTLLFISAFMCSLGLLPYSPVALVLSTLFILGVCWVTNTIFSKVFRAPTNVESVYISALILALIISPAGSLHDLAFRGWASVWAMASKYIFAIGKKHLFNPVAFAVALTALTLNQTASWWVGSGPLLPFVLIGGILIVRKLGRFHLVLAFLLTALIATTGFAVLQGNDILNTWQQIALYSPLFFFAAIILTEPLTTPPTQALQIAYGVMVGLLFVPQLHFGSFYLTPELAIVFGNLFSYLVSPKTKLILTLKKRIQIAPDTFDFIFVPNRRVAFAPGQYMEWTLGHQSPDSRGNRRYFTLASSPTEDNLRLGVKFYQHSSSFKRSMLAMDANTEIVAAQLAGDFVLPTNPNQRCILIAGGIGITPFRSMIKFLLDANQKRPITLFYANRSPNDIVYKDVFDQAQKRLGIKTIYTLTDPAQVPSNWTGKVGYINSRMIREQVPEYRKCLYYLSGPNAMVTAYQDTLLKMGVPQGQIKMDYFPGF
ncbi:MAG TPA: FAD-dependent oxidoreductase [Aggregatilineales bacterium]|nr:FAD-dependent oxidoreductase [Aggregatilineales bacterium]